MARISVTKTWQAVTVLTGTIQNVSPNNTIEVSESETDYSGQIIYPNEFISFNDVQLYMRSTLLSEGQVIVSPFAEGGAGGGSSSSVFCGLIKATDTSLPATRPDGTALKVGDYIKPAAGQSYPFTVAGITFSTSRDMGVYMDHGVWVVNANPYQSTSETPTSNTASESLSGTALFQSAVNSEVKQALTPYKHTQSTASSTWDILHNLNCYPSVCCTDSSGNQIIGEVVYPNSNEVVVRFSTAETGYAFLYKN